MPDLSPPAGEPELRLAELNIVEHQSIVGTPQGQVNDLIETLALPGYPCDGNLARRKAWVERRAAVLPEEYRKPLATLDEVPQSG